MATDNSGTTTVDVPPPPPPPPPPPESDNQKRADDFSERGRSLEPTPEFQKGLDDFSERRTTQTEASEAAPAPPESAAVAPADKGLVVNQPADNGLVQGEPVDNGPVQDRLAERGPAPNEPLLSNNNERADALSGRTDEAAELDTRSNEPMVPKDLSVPEVMEVPDTPEKQADAQLGPGAPPHPPDGSGAGPGSFSDTQEWGQRTGVSSVFLAETQENFGETSARAVDAGLHSWFQDDNLGKNPMGDYRADEKQFLETGKWLTPKHAALYAARGSASAPLENLYRGGGIPEADISKWKNQLDAGENPVTDLNAVSTSKDATYALIYAEAGSGGSQGIGKPADPRDNIENRAELVPRFEVLEHKKNFSDEVATLIARASEAGDLARIGQLEKVQETMGARLDDAGNLQAVPYREDVRRAAQEESVLWGKYELVGLVDSRQGHEFSKGNVGAVLPPVGDVPPGVYAVWRPL